MCRPFLLTFALWTALFLAAPLPKLHATITWTGSMDPTDPTTWTTSTTASVGYASDGTVIVDAGSDLFSRDGYLAYVSGYSGQVTINGTGSIWTNASNIKVGYGGNGILNVTNGGAVSDASAYIGGYVNGPAGATGVATVAGTGSSWTNNGELYVGYSGNGTLNINDGGAVTTTATTYVSYLPGSTGKINFNNGTFSTRTLAAATSDLMGTGTINTRGLVSDTAITFNSTASLNQTIVLNQPGQHLNVNLNVTSSAGDLGAGWKGNGTLAIQNGVNVISNYGVLGYNSSSTGTATVTGTNSKWSNNSILYVGRHGNGALDIRSGGSVSNTTGYVGEYAGSTGVVTVNGAGSSWKNSSDLYVGYYGMGTMNITGGATVTDAAGYIGDGGSSTLTSTVTVSGTGSKWTNKSSLYVGKGRLNITSGGVVEQGWAYIGTGHSTSSSPGLVSVSGVGTTWNSLGIRVAHEGDGKLTITDGATVNVAGGTTVGLSPYSFSENGTISFGSGGGTLNTESLWASPSQLMGAGTINASGLVSDIDLVFDSDHGLVQTLKLNSQPNQNITVNLNVTSAVAIGAGYKSNGSLTIRDGVILRCVSGQLGILSGSGLATVDGVGSTWNASSFLEVGLHGTGTLNVTGGGNIISQFGRIGSKSNVPATALIKGVGSKWTNAFDLKVGYVNSSNESGDGTMTIAEGGVVSDSSGYIASVSYSNGTVTVTGDGSTWNNSQNLAQVTMLRGVQP